MTLVDARRELGGRVALEFALPGLIEWRRVVDWRLTQINKMNNISQYPGSLMKADDILEFGFQDVIIATGARWRRDGVGRNRWQPVIGHGLPLVFTPDDLMNGVIPAGNVLIYDDDHYYLGSVLAELLLQRGCHVTLVTPAPLVGYWSQYTLEQALTQRKLMHGGAEIITQHTLKEIHHKECILACLTTGKESQVKAEGVVLVTDRLPNDVLYLSLIPALKRCDLESLRVIGDVEAPHIIARAIFSGHLAAREFEKPPTDDTPFRIERVDV